jgi:hypothetical protein
MNCKRSTLKKYQSRPSPPYPAQSCKGKKKKGNDGLLYVSSPSSTGVYRWTLSSTKLSSHKVHTSRKKKDLTTSSKTMKKSEKISKGAKEYEIHDNGGRPFCVIVYYSKKKVEVYLNEWVGDMKTGSYVKGKKIFETPYTTIFIGDNDLPYPEADLPKGVANGNSILVNVSGSKYIHIGMEIYSFETRDKEKIVHYYSPIGGNDVPYPYAVGENYTYFLLDYTTVPNEVLNLSKDGYTQYYGHPFKGQKREESESYMKKVIKPKIKKFSHKILYKRR